MAPRPARRVSFTKYRTEVAAHLSATGPLARLNAELQIGERRRGLRPYHRRCHQHGDHRASAIPATRARRHEAEDPWVPCLRVFVADDSSPHSGELPNPLLEIRECHRPAGGITAHDTDRTRWRRLARWRRHEPAAIAVGLDAKDALPEAEEIGNARPSPSQEHDDVLSHGELRRAHEDASISSEASTRHDELNGSRRASLSTTPRSRASPPFRWSGDRRSTARWSR